MFGALASSAQGLHLDLCSGRILLHNAHMIISDKGNKPGLAASVKQASYSCMISPALSILS